jgi:hypothetical protein
MRVGRMRMEGWGPSTASAWPRTSTPRGCQGGSTSSTTMAARPLRATSRNFLVAAKLWPVTSTTPLSGSMLHMPTGVTWGMPSLPTVATWARRRSPWR